VGIELLESRRLLSVSDAGLPNPPVPPPPLPIGNQPLAGVVGSPLSLSPAMMNQLYEFNLIYFNVGGHVTRADGTGETIAIVDAYGSPTIVHDSEVFDAQWGLTNSDGEGNFFLSVQPLAPTVNTEQDTQAIIQDWGLESSLDIEWAHSIAPGAHIDLIEAPSQSLLDLVNADAFAAAIPGVSVVSNSWGFPPNDPQFIGDVPRFDGFFTTPQSKLAAGQGVSFFFSSGDTGTLEYPAASIEVVGVGGLTENVDLSGNLISLGAWGGSGGGADTLYTPNFNVPLVSMDADPLTGVWVYDSSAPGGESITQFGSWIGEVGGTSLACPMWAAYFSTIDQGLALEGHGSLASPTTINDLEIAGEASPIYFTSPNTMPVMYPLWNVTMGPYPDPTKIPSVNRTGFGSPNPLALTDLFLSGNIEDLIPHGGVAPSNDVTQNGSLLDRVTFTQSPTNAIAGQAFAPPIVVQVDNDSNALDATYNGPVTLSLSQSNGTIAGTVSVTAVNGVATFSSVMVDSIGAGFVMQAAATNAISGLSLPFNVNPAAAVKVVFATEPTSTWQGAPFNVTIAVEDTFGNLEINDTSTVAISPSGSGFAGSLAVQASGGLATFTLEAENAGGPFTLTAADGALTPATSSGFDIVAVPTTLIRHYLFSGVPISAPLQFFEEQRVAVTLAANGPPPGVPVVIELDDPNPAAVITANTATPSVAAVQSAGSGTSDNDSQLLDGAANLRTESTTSFLAGQ